MRAHARETRQLSLLNVRGTAATVPFQRSRVNREWSSSWIAVVCAGLFSGAALYVTFVEHPARLEGRMELAITEPVRAIDAAL